MDECAFRHLHSRSQLTRGAATQAHGGMADGRTDCAGRHISAVHRRSEVREARSLFAHQSNAPEDCASPTLSSASAHRRFGGQGILGEIRWPLFKRILGALDWGIGLRDPLCVTLTLPLQGNTRPLTPHPSLPRLRRSSGRREAGRQAVFHCRAAALLLRHGAAGDLRSSFVGGREQGTHTALFCRLVRAHCLRVCLTPSVLPSFHRTRRACRSGITFSGASWGCSGQSRSW